jgi:hypothetical protein
MEPQLIDHYNKFPSGINVINKMNEELAVLQKKYDMLKEKHTKYVKEKEQFLMPNIRVNTISELKIYTVEDGKEPDQVKVTEKAP